MRRGRQCPSAAAAWSWSAVAGARAAQQPRYAALTPGREPSRIDGKLRSRNAATVHRPIRVGVFGRGRFKIARRGLSIPHAIGSAVMRSSDSGFRDTKEVPVLAYFSRAVYLAASLTVSLIGSQALAKGDTLLPGGATSLREGYGDWVVSCAIATQNGASRKVCSLSQQQTNTQSHQRILALQLQPKASAVAGTLLLPFGLDLAKGVTLQIDGGAVMASLPFRTCLPAGCLVGLDFNAKSVAALRAGTNLKVNVFPVNGQAMTLSVSLNGFPKALDRTIALLK